MTLQRGSTRSYFSRQRSLGRALRWGQTRPRTPWSAYTARSPYSTSNLLITSISSRGAAGLSSRVAVKFPGSAATLVREESLTSTGFFPLHRDEVYELPADNLFLAGTAEVGLVGLHADEVLSESELPLLYAGVSPCYRREAGSAGRDVRGLPYQIVECSTGDMGLGKFRMNDINTWFPSFGTFRETHSCSTLHDWQARRARIRYKDSSGRIHFAHTLNNTAVATPRLLAALVENHQTVDHQVRVPEVLQPYLSGRQLL